MFKWWFKKALKLVLLLFVLLVGFLLFERIRGQMCLSNYRRELAAKGEKLTPQELSVSVPIEENGSAALAEGIQKLTNGLALPAHPPPKMAVLPSGRAVIGFRETEWIDDDVTNRWEQVELDLRTNEVALAIIRAALAMPRFNNELDYSQGMDLLLPHLANVKPLSMWFGAETQLAIRQGRNKDVRTNLVALSQLPRLLEEDCLLISELVRIAAATIANFSLWEALQSDVMTEEDLAMVQAAWEAQSFATNMALGLEGDRIYSDASYDLVRGSNEGAVIMLYGLEEWLPVEDDDRPWWERSVRALPHGEAIAKFIKEQIYCRIWRFAWSHQAQCRGMRTFQRLAELTRLGSANQSLADLRIGIESVEAESLGENFYERLRFPSGNWVFTISSSVRKAMRAETERSMAICAIALKRWFLRHGQYPESLDQLVPEFLPAVPIDYMDGQPLKYRTNGDGGFTLYSVGEDGVDGGGDVSLRPDQESSRNLWHRKDYVWPTPALPVEVESWRKEVRES